MNVDATQEGQNNIQTLINGMQLGHYLYHKSHRLWG